jgi:hypothetical protein
MRCRTRGSGKMQEKPGWRREPVGWKYLPLSTSGKERELPMSVDARHAMDQIVVDLFENRSFDNILGYLYGSGDGKTFSAPGPPGLRSRDSGRQGRPDHGLNGPRSWLSGSVPDVVSTITVQAATALQHGRRTQK